MALESARLHLGCGRTIIPGFINIDVIPGDGVDIVCDLANLESLSGQPWYGNVHLVYLSHVLEHFATAEVLPLLRRIHALLCNGGSVHISVPDLDKICRYYIEHADWFNPPHNPWIGIIYGGQITEYDFHKTGFNFAYLNWLLVESGFSNVREAQGGEIYGIRDGSGQALPFGTFSLTVQAQKGNEPRETAVFEYTLFEHLLARVSLAVEYILNGLVWLRIKFIRRRLGRSKRRTAIYIY